MTDIIVGIKISGFGDPESNLVDNRIRFVSVRPHGLPGNQENLYIQCLKGYPATAQTEANVRLAQATIGGMSFGLTAKDEVTTRFMAEPAKVGDLVNAVSASDVIFDIALRGVPVTGLEFQNIVLERECITPIQENSPGNYTVARAQANTIAQAHGVGLTSDTAIFPANRGPTLVGRQIEFFRMPADGGPSDEKRIWQGGILTVEESSGVVTVTCDDILSIINRRKLFVRRVKLPLEQPTSIGINRISQELDEDPPSADEGGESLFCVAGQTVLRVKAFQQGKRVWSWPFPSGRAVGGAPDWQELLEARPDEQDAWEVLCTNQAYQPSINGKYPSPNPVILALQILTTTTGGNNGSYDLGNAAKPWIGRQWGLGIPREALDVPAFEDVAFSLSPAQYYNNLWIGLEGEPQNALEWLQRLLKPIACVISGDGKGSVRVVKLGDTPDLDAVTILRRNCHGSPRQGRRLTEPYETIEALYNEVPGRKTRARTLNNVKQLQRQTDGGADVETVNVRGLRTLAEAQNLASQLIAAFSAPPKIVKIATNRTLDFAIGTVQRITHESIFNENGTRGVTGVSAFVEGKEQTLGEGKNIYKFRIVPGRRARIAPSAKLKGAGGSVELEIDQTLYTKPGGPFVDDTDGFAVGDLVRILAPDFSVRDAGPYTLVGVTSALLTLDAVSGAVTGDIIESVPYDNPPTTNQTDKWAYIGDETTRLINGDDPYEWSV